MGWLDEVHWNADGLVPAIAQEAESGAVLTQAATKHWWRSRVDPFEHSWSLVEGWLQAEPEVTAKALMQRLCVQFPDVYPTGAQLRTLQRRAQLWRKGEQSGHVQRVREIRLDCDNDAILLVVEQAGGIACHTGRHRCFFQRLEDGAWKTVEPVLEDPAAIYGR